MEHQENSPLDEAFSPVRDEEVEAPLSLETQSLLQTGHLVSEVNVGSHRIEIRSLRVGEEFQAALLAKRYEETVEAGRALATALVAAAIMRVDGKPLVGDPLTAGDLTLEAKFLHILDNWYWPPIQRVYNEYGVLIKGVTDAYEQLGKA